MWLNWMTSPCLVSPVIHHQSLDKYDEMAEPINVLTAKPDSLGLIPGTNMVEGED